MGLEDRDYMREHYRNQLAGRKQDGTPSYFRPPPERTVAGTVIFVIMLLGTLFVLYKGSETWLARREAARSAAAAVVSPPPEPPQAQPVVRAITGLPPSAFVIAAQPARPTPGGGVVMKCQGAGGTSYSDGACPAGTRATSVTLPVGVQSVGVAAPAQAMPATAATPPAMAPAPQVIVVQNGPSIHAQRQQECQALEAEITHLDAWALQPQSAQAQDHIRDRRKQARDRQFALHC